GRARWIHPLDHGLERALHRCTTQDQTSRNATAPKYPVGATAAWDASGIHWGAHKLVVADISRCDNYFWCHFVARGHTDESVTYRTARTVPDQCALLHSCCYFPTRWGNIRGTSCLWVTRLMAR